MMKYNKTPDNDDAFAAYINKRCPYCRSKDVLLRVFSYECYRCHANWLVRFNNFANLSDGIQFHEVKAPDLSPMEILALETGDKEKDGYV